MIDLKKVISRWSVDSYGGLHFDTADATEKGQSSSSPILSSLSTDQFKCLVEQTITNCQRPLSFAQEVDEVEEVRALWFRIAKRYAHLIAPLVKASRKSSK